METSFISKYKPYYINDFKLDKETHTTLKTLLEIDDLNVMIYGRPGSGKTMLLESLIREYYDLKPYKCFPEHNILYINHLREQGIHYYRNEMKTFCQSQSIVYGKKKMILIDDVDSVNEQSQQVFRNYMDSYSKNVHFVLVCTNIQKVVESIQSRTHIIHLKPLQEEQIRKHLDHVVLKENIHLCESSKNYLMSISNNSVRVLIGFLEKLYLSGENIDIDKCKSICNCISEKSFEDYIDAFNRNDLQNALEILHSLYECGYSVIDIFDYFFNFLKKTNLIDEDMKYKMIPFLCKYIMIFHNCHENSIALIFFTNRLFQIR